MANAKEADYKNVALEEEDIVEMRKAVATGSAKAEVPTNSGTSTCTILVCFIDLCRAGSTANCVLLHCVDSYDCRE